MFCPRYWLNFLPPKLRAILFYRFFFDRAHTRKSLFKQAPLSFLPGIRMDLSPNDKSHQQIAYTGFFELHLSKIFMKLANRGGFFVDVGANYGYYSLLWAGARNSNEVLAYEAVRKNSEALTNNASINHLIDRIKVENKALGQSNGQMNFDLIDSSQTTWGGLTQKMDSGFNVSVHRLDELLESDKTIDVLKIDVEGADTWVLYGAERILREKRIKNIFFEENKKRQQELGINRKEAEIFLLDMDYSLKKINFNASGVSEFHACPKV